MAKLPTKLMAALTHDEVRIVTWFAPFIEQAGYKWTIIPENKHEVTLIVEKRCTEVQ